MISRQTIDRIKELPVNEVVEKYVKLKKAGANYKAKSPFTNEKTPSFTVSPAKNIWKCFSSGKGGSSGIQFVMDYLGVSFYDAVIEVGKQFNISIEHENDEKAKEYLKTQEIKQTVYDYNLFAAELYYKQAIDSFDEYADQFRYSKEIIEQYQIGLALDSNNQLLEAASQQGKSKSNLKSAGLIKSKKNIYYDVFRNRIIFPFKDWYGNITGFSGRSLEWKKGDKFPKYLNTSDTKAFNKSKELFGLYQAKKSILETKRFNLVEGQFDVLAMQTIVDKKGHHPFLNTVAASGTSFTEDHAAFLKSHSDTCRLILDGDEAGLRAADKTIRLLLNQGYFVEVVILPEGEDPDSFKDGLVDFIEKNTQDGFSYLANTIMAGKTIQSEKIKAQQELELMLSEIPDITVRNNYTAWAAKKHNILKTEVERNVKKIITQKSEENESFKFKIPKGGKIDDLERYGFVEVYGYQNQKTGYHFPSSGAELKQQSNFVVIPLIHIYSRTSDSNKRIFKIKNKTTEALLEVKSKTFVSLTAFQEEVEGEGHFLWDGEKNHFKKLKHKIYPNFKICYELSVLGWQKEGFFSFSNGIVTDRFIEIDNYGVVEHDDVNYYLPAFSDIYKMQRSDSDNYENERYFKFRKGEVSFGEWNKQFIRVHGDNGIIGTAFIIASLFRDVLFGLKSNFPHLFLFGGTSRGKSYFARSINEIFFYGQAPFNLSSGTPVGFTRRLSQVRNAPVWFDEYENSIDRQRLQLIKASYDGAGHEKGVKESRNRTEMTKIECSSIISGQYMPTWDDGAIFNRVLLLTFDIAPEHRTKEDKKEGDILYAMQKSGLSNILVEVLKYRSLIEENISSTMRELEEQLKTDIQSHFSDDPDKAKITGRLLENYALIFSVIKLLNEKMNFAFSYEEAYNLVKNQIISQSSLIADTDSLSTFWSTVEYLYMDYKINYNNDFKIEYKLSANFINKHNEEYEWTSNSAKDEPLIYIRLGRLHPLYMEAHKRQHGENGHGKTSLIEYFKNHKAYVGRAKSTHFGDTSTSAYVFNYKQLGITMDEGSNGIQKQHKDENTPISSSPGQEYNPDNIEGEDDDLPF